MSKFAGVSFVCPLCLELVVGRMPLQYQSGEKTCMTCGARYEIMLKINEVALEQTDKQ